MKHAVKRLRLFARIKLMESAVVDTALGYCFTRAIVRGTRETKY